ncbi:hypothetical protein LTR66_005190 [Elasticomyces elasticus]|nr:hypothetical protein LTR66_005190 [Elasticomyces elasticus]
MSSRYPPGVSLEDYADENGHGDPRHPDNDNDEVHSRQNVPPIFLSEGDNGEGDNGDEDNDGAPELYEEHLSSDMHDTRSSGIVHRGHGQRAHHAQLPHYDDLAVENDYDDPEAFPDIGGYDDDRGTGVRPRAQARARARLVALLNGYGMAAPSGYDRGYEAALADHQDDAVEGAMYRGGGGAMFGRNGGSMYGGNRSGIYGGAVSPRPDHLGVMTYDRRGGGSRGGLADAVVGALRRNAEDRMPGGYGGAYAGAYGGDVYDGGYGGMHGGDEYDSGYGGPYGDMYERGYGGMYDHSYGHDYGHGCGHGYGSGYPRRSFG